MEPVVALAQYAGHNYAYLHVEAVEQGEKIMQVLFLSILNPIESAPWLGELDALAPISKRMTVTALPLRVSEEPLIPSLSEESLAVRNFLC